MILRRYGKAFHSVEPNFDPKAMNEVGFRRDGAHTIPAEDFEAGWERHLPHELAARAEGDVQLEAEGALLDKLRADVEALAEGVPEGSFLVVENEQGKDWPRLHCEQRTLVVGNENRLHFRWHVEPPLRVALFIPKG